MIITTRRNFFHYGDKTCNLELQDVMGMICFGAFFFQHPPCVEALKPPLKVQEHDDRCEQSRDHGGLWPCSAGGPRPRAP